MIELQPRVKKLLYAFLILLAVSIPFFLYFTQLKPIKVELQAAENRLETEEALLATVEQKLMNQQNQVTNLSSTELQRQVPVAPLVDQFILDLEKSEILADSLIINYQFSMSSFEGIGVDDDGSTLEIELEDGLELTEPMFDSDEMDESITNDIGTIQEGIERVTVQMSVISPGYSEMMSFIRELEQLTRVTTINRLLFSGNQEIRLLDQTMDDLQFVIEVSTYYLPGLEELQGELPLQDYENPSNKFNPLFPGDVDDAE